MCWGDFECGRLTPEEFARTFLAAWPLSMSEATFLDEFATWTRDLLPGARQTLEELRPRYRVAALSNSNPLHWRRVTATGLPDLLDGVFASHLIGARKPSPQAYERVLADMDVSAGATTFFDDLEENVTAARRAGMRAFRVAGVEELRACLRELGCLEGHESAAASG